MHDIYAERLTAVLNFKYLNNFYTMWKLFK